MLHGIDHVVIVVRDLTQAAADYERAGFTVTPGGVHADGATHNALISFRDGAYIELIAFKEPDQPQTHPRWPRLGRGEGLVHYALLSTDLAADVAELRRRGAVVQDPTDSGRRRPDGQELRWRTAWLEGGSTLPFLIEDLTPRGLRVPGDSATHHRLPINRVVGLRVAVDELAPAQERLRLLLGAGQDGASAEGSSAVRLRVGTQWIEVVRPEDSASDAAAALARYGAGPYELVLGADGTDASTGDLGELPAGAMHGARIRMVTAPAA